LLERYKETFWANKSKSILRWLREPYHGKTLTYDVKDALSYRSVDVPSSRIFTVDPSGALKQELIQNFKSSYQQLNDIVDQVFPSVRQSMNTTYADFSYWREPLPGIVDNILDIDQEVSNVYEDSSSESEIELPQ
jgi:hypothetical protein